MNLLNWIKVNTLFCTVDAKHISSILLFPHLQPYLYFCSEETIERKHFLLSLRDQPHVLCKREFQLAISWHNLSEFNVLAQCLGTTSKIPSCDWSTQISLVILLGSHWSNKCTLLRPGWHQVLQYKCTEAGFLLTVQLGQAKCVPQFSMKTL